MMYPNTLILVSLSLAKSLSLSAFSAHFIMSFLNSNLSPYPFYSGVVSLRNCRLVIFLGKLNHLELWGADIGNAYLEAFTDEKLNIVAGPEFQELEG